MKEAVKLKMLCFILFVTLAAVLASCAFFSPRVPESDNALIAVMWCESCKSYTEWEVRDAGYFFCTGGGTVWRFARDVEVRK